MNKRSCTDLFNKWNNLELNESHKNRQPELEAFMLNDLPWFSAYSSSVLPNDRSMGSIIRLEREGRTSVSLTDRFLQLQMSIGAEEYAGVKEVLDTRVNLSACIVRREKQGIKSGLGWYSMIRKYHHNQGWSCTSRNGLSCLPALSR